jgi:hypothetical protein
LLNLFYFYYPDIDDVVEDDKESESGYTVNFENNQFTLSSEHFSHIQNKIQTVTKQVRTITVLFILIILIEIILYAISSAGSKRKRTS